MTMEFVQVPGWERYPWLRHGFSTRHGGDSTVYGGRSLNLGWTKEDDPGNVIENRRRFYSAVTGASGPSAITLRQVHSANIRVVHTGDGPFETPEGQAIVEGDCLMTGLAGTLLGIQTADCVPVMLIDVEQRAVAVLHAGWRGTVAGIVEQGVARMRQEFSSYPEDLVAAVGPSIGVCCYTIGDEVRDAFHARFSYAASLFHRDHLDLWEANRRQLVEAGVSPARIAVVGECTGCALTTSGDRKYFSHRIDHGVTGRMMSVVGIAAR